MSQQNVERILDGRVALVTGGSRGIGRSLCLALAHAGAAVAVNYARNQAMAEEVVREIESAGSRAIAVGFDVANEEAVEAGIKTVLEKFGQLDILVNNAGITNDNLLLRTKKESWDEVIATNLTGTFLCSRTVLKPMMKARRGAIINISSIIGEMGNVGQAAYSASKAGLLGFTKSLAKEVGSRNITVNAVTPGFIKTEMTDTLSEEHVKKMQEQIPLGRLGDPEDVAGLVVFLSSPNATYITGQVLGVNGGMYM